VSTEQKQNRFILGAIIGGFFTYYLTGGSVPATIAAAILVGLFVSVMWK
jgi:hypothetical protein